MKLSLALSLLAVAEASNVRRTQQCQTICKWAKDLCVLFSSDLDLALIENYVLFIS